MYSSKNRDLSNSISGFLARKKKRYIAECKVAFRGHAHHAQKHRVTRGGGGGNGGKGRVEEGGHWSVAQYLSRNFVPTREQAIRHYGKKVKASVSTQ